MNRLTRGDVERMLSDRRWEPAAFECFEQHSLEIALGRLDCVRWPRSSHRSSFATPSFPRHRCSSRYDQAVGRRDEPEVPGILGGAVEPVLVAHGSEPPQHPHRRGDDEPVGSHDPVGVAVPPAPVHVDPARHREFDAGSERSRGSTWRCMLLRPANAPAVHPLRNPYGAVRSCTAMQRIMKSSGDEANRTTPGTTSTTSPLARDLVYVDGETPRCRRVDGG